MTRMEFLVQENARLDRIHEQLLQGVIPVEPIMVDQMWEDDNGCLTVIPAAPAARKRYLGRPITTGPIARKLRSDSKTLFSQCSHCRK